jgi:hypothetical protein
LPELARRPSPPPARARLTVAHKLPELAAAVGARFGEVNITQIGPGDSPFASIAHAVASLLALARAGDRPG